MAALALHWDLTSAQTSSWPSGLYGWASTEALIIAASAHRGNR